MRVVPAFDVLEYFRTGVGVRTKGTAVDEFTLQGGEEALAHRVVVAVADRAHGWPDSHFLASFSESD